MRAFSIGLIVFNVVSFHSIHDDDATMTADSTIAVVVGVVIVGHNMHTHSPAPNSPTVNNIACGTWARCHAAHITGIDLEKNTPNILVISNILYTHRDIQIHT